MGPFVPDIITDELNLVFGFLIGIAFGFVLEQAGFSSSRKLTGLFYGRDFTVLRVFFSAAITAMSGIVILAYAGILDTEIIYINPTYLWAAIIGGLIMGVGFVVGGYCPGTSLCGAAIGKVDAMIFIGGGALGVFMFGEVYPSIEALYNGSYLGDITVPTALGLSPGLFTLFVIVIAIAAFIITTKIEPRIRAEAISTTFPARYHKIAAIGVLAVGILLLYLPDRKTNMLAKVADEQYVNAQSLHNMTVDEFAFRILDNDPKLQIIDTRNDSEFAAMRLPYSINIPIEQMFGKQWSDVLSNDKIKVFVANDELDERKAMTLALMLGYNKFYFLEGGLKEFTNTYLNVPPSSTELSQDMNDRHRFRTSARGQLAKIIKNEIAGTVRKTVPLKKIAGGCGS